eukprot:1096029-Amorphochlora_amoeboformis.AAC.1
MTCRILATSNGVGKLVWELKLAESSPSIREGSFFTNLLAPIQYCLADPSSPLLLDFDKRAGSLTLE